MVYLLRYHPFLELLVQQVQGLCKYHAHSFLTSILMPDSKSTEFRSKSKKANAYKRSLLCISLIFILYWYIILSVSFFPSNRINKCCFLQQYNSVEIH